MSIIFGWNEFRVKSIKPEEAGIYRKDIPPDLTFEGRLKYFHLFFIPFFGLGKRWIMRRGAEMFQMPADFQDAIHGYGIRIPTPWYTFLGPILIVLGGFGFQLYQDLQEKKKDARSKEYQDKYAAILKYHLTHINSDALIQISEKRSREEACLKVQEVRGDTLICLKFPGPKNMSNPDDAAWAAARYVKDKPKQEEVIVSKAALEQAFTGAWERYGPKIQGVDLFGDSLKWQVHSISFPFSPNLLWGASSGASTRAGKTRFNLEIRDYGEDCELIDIQTVEGSAVWDKSSLPQKVTSSHSFRVNGENYSPQTRALKFRLVVKDSTSKVHTFEFEHSEAGRWVRKVFD